MKIAKLLSVLYQMKALTPKGMFSLAAAVLQHGINVMALLDFAKRRYGEKEALIEEEVTLTYQQLWSQAGTLAAVFYNRYGLRNGRKIAVLCQNHARLIQTIFAASRVGADIYLLNPEIGRQGFRQYVQQYSFDLLVYDSRAEEVVTSSYAGEKVCSTREQDPSIPSLLQAAGRETQRIPRQSMGSLVLLTGGTTGKPKEAPHQPSLFSYLNPFLSMLSRLKLGKYETAYIATPLYHGYGIAVLLLFAALGKKIVIRRTFQAREACEVIRRYQIEVMTVVPIMLYKLMETDPDSLTPLDCIASGGAPLSPDLADKVIRRLGPVLYNLYGTSETGLLTIASPSELRYSLSTIGKPIHGVKMKVEEDGELFVQNNASARNQAFVWISTGDLASRDLQGYYFLQGRSEERIVSGGENVYPIEIEQLLQHHPRIADAAVAGIPDEPFGERLKAWIQPALGAVLTEEELRLWLRSEAARFQMPKEIVFVSEIPYTPLGKVDKSQLKD
ncbi:AMP-binding protein [Salibacterium aidingense]|uniref:AMP-binding protein n=1 Tax=Salibacterium aidingense TaxID=384933 RepID=UPI000411F9C9|nr:AMP-binding protein [Salibacterium aidingense]